MNNLQFLLMSGAAAEGEGAIMDTIISFAPIVIIFAVFYFVIIRPQQKRDKEDKAMRENLEIGDEVCTIGGIVGIVASIKEDTVVIETGSDRSKIRVLKSAISQNNSAKEKASAEK